MVEEKRDKSSEVVLLLDESPQSRQAIIMLRESRIPFKKISASGFDLPAILWGDGYFPLLSNIQHFVGTILPSDVKISDDA